MFSELGNAVAVRWGVKRSFVEYVQDAEGLIELVEPGRISGDIFEFPRVEFDESGKGRIAFGGGLRFTAYGGLLDVEIADPAIEVRGNELMLTVRSRRSRRDFAFLEYRASRGTESELLAFLTLDGAGALGDVYPVRTPVDPLVLILGEE